MTTHTVLLVEDNPADVAIAQRALRESSHGPDADWRIDLVVARDGAEALEYLLGDRPVPALVLLDVNLPGLTGRQVLERIRATPRLRTLPVVVLTTSRRAEDIQEMYAAGANSYIEKPQEYRRFVALMDVVQRYWFDVAQLPT